jgi:hypothetical protein
VAARWSSLRGWRRDLLVALGAMALAAALVLPTLASHDGNVSVFLRVGKYSASRPYVQRDFHHPILTPDYGLDGQQFYVVAATFPHARDAMPYVDHIRYRFRRILFPMLVSPFGQGPTLVWAMFGLNLLAIGAAAIALGRLADRLGGSPFFGVLVAITPALIESLQGSLGDALAFALALWAVVMWRRSIVAAVVLFTLAALTRETTLIAAAACFVVGDARQRRWLLIPPAIWAAWAVIITVWLPSTAGPGSSLLMGDGANQFTWPFHAWLQLGLGSASSELGIVLLVASLAAAWQLRQRLPEVTAWLLFDSVILVCANLGVALNAFNLSRVAAMAVPGLVLAYVDRSHAGRRPAEVAAAAG